MPVTFESTPNAAILRLTGAMVEDSAIDMRDAIRQARDYWKYDRLRLEINSPGGELLALRALIHEMRWWRIQGGHLQTLALMQAGSAAALALSLGDVGTRTVQPHTVLVYHFTRFTVQDKQTLTALNATTTARQLEQQDKTLLNEITQHLLQGYGDIEAFARAGLARCRQISLEAKAISASLGGGAGFGLGNSGPSAFLLRKIVKVYEKMMSGGQTKPYLDLLSEQFECDCRMPVDIAWALLLIDAVEAVPALQAAMELQNVAETARVMRQAA